MKGQSIEDLYVDQLRDLYDAERQIIKALPKMIRAAASDELKAALNQHLEVTKEQEQRIVQIFEGRGEKLKAQKCKGMNGVLEEGSELVEKDWEEVVRDAAIIAAAQRVEHYEMSGYGTACALATLLGEDEAAQLLEKTLEEEKEADQKLTDLSESINEEARDQSEEGVSGKEPRTETRKELSPRKKHVA